MGSRESKESKDPKDWKPKREWTWFKNRTGGTCHFKPGESEGSKEAPEKIRANAASPMDSQKDKSKAGPSNHNNKKMSCSKKDTLRAEGRCFNCHEMGHEQRNCPKLNLMKPPRQAVNTRSIHLTNLDRLAREKDRADAFVGSMSLIGYDDAEIFMGPAADRTPSSVREGGYPPIENYTIWDWPALNWLRKCLNSQIEHVIQE